MDDEPFSDQAQRLLYIAQQNGDRLHALINDVLDFEKFSAQQMRFDLSTHRIVTLVEEAILANLASGDKFGVRFDMVCPDRTLTGVVDPQRFQQVMTNLLSNAAKFAHTGSTVRVAVEEQEDAVRIAVTSDGEKIPESFREHLFQPFSQADSATTRARGGTGLGLAITKQIVEQTGGAIDFDSTEGEGTTFWFTVPSPKPQ
jgi:signal transduction histidine kinase